MNDQTCPVDQEIIDVYSLFFDGTPVSAKLKAALPLYRCLKPLWYTRVCDLQEAGNDPEKIRKCLDRIEYYQTADIDFAGCMG